MIPTVGAVVVAACGQTQLRAPAELANAQHEGVVKHAAFIKIGEEAGQRLVEHGRGLILHTLGQA